MLIAIAFRTPSLCPHPALTQRLRRWGMLAGWGGSVLLLGGLPEVALAQDATLRWQPREVTRMLGGFIQQRLPLSGTQPASARKIPADVTAPSYGEIRIGPLEKQGTRAVLLDEPKGKPARLFLDADGNGDLTDDPPVSWALRNIQSANGTTAAVYVGEGSIKIPYPNGALDGRLGFYRPEQGKPGVGPTTNTIYYYRDYALDGQVMLAGKSYKAMLVDEFALGDFRGRPGGDFSGVRMLIDLNSDGLFDMRRESLDVRQPFNVGGTTWEFGEMTADGKFKFVRSRRTAPEIVIPPSLVRGGKAIPFTAKTTAGKAVKFPDDYKGKVVLLDFWATWCGPCLSELPNVVENHGKYHSKGFEILGVSLDKAESVSTLASFTKERNMSWPQICDGTMWQAELAQRYGVESIPFMLLVDGDTGRIMGSKDEVRGPNLGPAIEAALAARQAKSR